MHEIGRAASQERYRLELNLDPAHLGKIKVYLDSDANKQIQVHLVVDQNASRQIIEQHLPALRQSLAQHGLDMGGFSMDSQQNQDSQASASQHEQGDFAATTNKTIQESAEPQKSGTNARLSIRV
jgi:flagellar hook-length control protein FliK